jgi:hypothetical protein
MPPGWTRRDARRFGSRVMSLVGPLSDIAGVRARIEEPTVVGPHGVGPKGYQ